MLCDNVFKHVPNLIVQSLYKFLGVLNVLGDSANALKILLVRIVFPHVTRVVLTLDVDAKTGDLVAAIQYSGASFDPLSLDGKEAEAAKFELFTFVKSARYHLPASGKNEVIITV